MTLATIRSITLATIRSGYLHRISTPLARLRETGSLSCRAMPPAPAAAAPARTIVVVEDEASIASAVAARLRSEGFVVEIADDGPGGVEVCERLRPDLVVLDLMLPGLDGLEVCRRIQHDRPVPVLMLTARDLVARVHALLRRVDRAGAAAAKTDEMLLVAGVELDLATRRVRRGGETV